MGFGLHTYDYVEVGIPVLRIQNLKNLTVTKDRLRYISKEKHNELKKSQVKPLDIIISKTGVLGMIGIVPKDYGQANLNQALARITLKDKKIISKHATYITDKTSDLFFVEHDLLVNWFLIHLLQIERINQRFKILFFTTSSHNLAQGDSRGSLIMEHFLNNDKPDKTYTMIPDGVFTITDKKTNRSLLFFLEVDMGSETVASPTQSQKDIKQKVNNYQALFKYETYKKYKPYQ